MKFTKFWSLSRKFEGINTLDQYVDRLERIIRWLRILQKSDIEIKLVSTDGDLLLITEHQIPEWDEQ